MAEPQVWIGCLACYNAGRLVGEWVDAIEAGDKTPADIHGDEDNLHRLEIRDGGSPHEELWCMDHQDFKGLLDGECSPMEAQRIAEVLAKLIEEMGGGHEDDELIEAYAGWLNYTGERADEAHIDSFREDFGGIWESAVAYAQNWADEIGAEVDDAIWPFDCIDWERAARELSLTTHRLGNYKLAIYTIN